MKFIDMMSKAIATMDMSLVIISIWGAGNADVLVRNEREARKHLIARCAMLARAPSVLGA